MTPTAEVIAVTRFLGVPETLMNAENAEARDRHQDRGTDAERLTECAGRTCYDSYGKGRSSTEYHKHILEVGHGSVLEHASISFYLTHLSRGCTHDLVRHRAGTAISQRSTRYVNEAESEWCWHPLIEEAAIWNSRRGLSGSEMRYGVTEDGARAAYEAIVTLVTEYLASLGVDKLTTRKQARAAARGALGNALSTALVWTANIRALRNVLEQRASPHADAEIRLLANALYEAALPHVPAYLADYRRVECPDGIGYGLETSFRKV